ncbi:DNA-binding response regulator [Dyadobacter luteus]|jgi:two-component system response regulator LytT|uniref:DNA-binding response regulator n=1 Tax=Dyadobacter luteus TaxID=2259619 RepID=A0A3D8Y8V9_9BACT|nr:LytTR family DNA-binding domain-containing protein [Dyadobacter luteus]REA59755.1 DNA-binding response regulator [Dyadobacter luteus]
MIKDILIIEDEKPNASRLRRLITEINPNARILDVIESVCDSVAWFESHTHPDLVMMDVRLADGLSFEILEKVEIKSMIIFTTAYDEYAVRAFKFNSIDYLLKPIEPDELANAFRMAESRQGTSPAQSIEGLLSQYLGKEYRTRFLLPYRDGFKTVLVKDIEYFYSESKITRASLNDGTEETLSQTLEELEQQLDPKQFFRANRQFIIHYESIKQIHNHFNGKLKVELKKSSETEVIVSRDKAIHLKNWMDY